MLKIKINSVLLILAIISLCVPASSFAGWEVQVLDEVSQGPVRKARIYLDGELVDKTGYDGIGNLPNPMPKSDSPRQIKVTSQGYETKTKKWDSTPKLKFILNPSNSNGGVTYGVVTGGGGNDEGSFKINVQVHNSETGRPIPNANIKWYHGINVIDKQSTPSNGEITLTSQGDVSTYLYKDNGLEVHASGYSLGRLDNIKFDEGGRRINASFNLKPE